VEQGQAADAEPLLREGLQLLREHFRHMPELIAEAEDWLGASLSAQRRYAVAEPLLLSGQKTLKDHPGVSAKLKGLSKDHLVELYKAWGKPDKAAEWQRR